MPGGTCLTKCLSQLSCTPACTPRSAWVFGSGATGCEEAQPIAVAACPSEGNAAGASWAALAFASCRSDSAVAFRSFATWDGSGRILLDAAHPMRGGVRGVTAVPTRRLLDIARTPSAQFYMRLQ